MRTQPFADSLCHLAAITFLAAAETASAAEIGISYSGASGGNWSSSGNWTPAIVPNNGADVYNVTVPSPLAVNVDGTFSIRFLDLDPGSAATLPPGRSLTLSHGATIDGVLNMGEPGNFSASRIQLAGDMAFGGSGTAELRGVPVIESAAGARLTVGPNLALHWLGTNGGFGGFPAGIGLTNRGVIDFEGAGNNNISHTEGNFINSGVFRVRNSSNVYVSPVGNPILFDNSGTVVVDGGLLDLEGVSIKNTDSITVRNNGILDVLDDFDNNGGILMLENGGKLSTSNFFGVTFSGGSISGEGGIIAPQGLLTLQGSLVGNPLGISDTSVLATGGNTVELSGGINLTDVAFSGNGIRIKGNTAVSGNSLLPLQLSGSTGDDSLTLSAGITMATGASAGPGSITVKTTHTDGSVNVDSSDFTIGTGCALTSTGATRLFPNALFTAAGTFTSTGGTVQLDSGSRLAGDIALNGSTVTGAGEIRPTALGIAGSNQIGTSVETGTTAVTVTGVTTVLGSGALSVNQGSSGTTSLNAAAPVATLTTGPDFDVSVSANHTLTTNLPWNFQGLAGINGGVMVIAADFDNDGAINLTGGAQLQVNKSISTNSTGSINAATGTTVTVNGAAELGGILTGNGAFNFSGAVPVFATDYNGSGAVTVSSGANVGFSQNVGNIPAITVNSNNASLSFNGGLGGFGTASVDGSGGVFNVTGNTTATGLLQIRNGATHGGTGTTTAQGDLEIDGKLNGRKLIAENPTTARRINMSNNATFVNRDIFSFFSFGLPATVSGDGFFRNAGTITQAVDPFGGVIPTNTVSADFEQTAAGNLAPKSEIALTGNSVIAGTATLADGAKLTLGAGADDTTHSVTGAISGGGTLNISGNTGTGAAPTVTISGTVDLSGQNSGTEIRDGATLQLVGGQVAPALGRRVQILNDSQLLCVEHFLGPFIIALLEYGVADIRGPVPEPGQDRQKIEAGQLNATPNDSPGARIENVHIEVTDRCSTQGRTDWINSLFETGPGSTTTLGDGTSFTSTTGDGACANSGGTWVIPEFALVELSETLPFQDHEGNTSVRNHGELSINGSIVSGTSIYDVSQGGVLRFDGPATLIDTTMTARAGSGTTAGGTISITNPKELRNTTITAENNAEVEIIMPANSEDREKVKNVRVFSDSGIETKCSLLGIFFPGATTEFLSKGGAVIYDLTRTQSTGTQSTLIENSSGNAALGLSPGNPIGRFQVVGDLPLGSGSEITIEMGGTARATQYDLLAVTGILTATNTALRPLFTNNFQSTISPTDTFTVIETTQPIAGTFSNVSAGRVMAADGTGSFSVTMASGNTRVILGDFMADSDKDGMPDEFEQEHFGHPTDAKPGNDRDNDGQSNLDEFTAGTDPTDFSSVLRIKKISRVGNDVVITFDAAPNKAYRIEAGTTLADGFPLFIQNVAATPEGGTHQVTHVGAGTLPARFYRAVTPPPP